MAKSKVTRSLMAIAVGALATLPAMLHAQQNDQFQVPWALEFLPDGRLLVSEGVGKLKLLNTNGAIGEITGVPEVSFGGQGGFADIVLHPDYASNRIPTARK